MNFRKCGAALLLLLSMAVLPSLAVSAFGGSAAPTQTEWNTNAPVSRPEDEAPTLSQPEQEPAFPAEKPLLPPEESGESEEPGEQVEPEENFFAFTVTVTDGKGSPIPGTYVTAGEISGTAGEDGVFSFHAMESSFPLHVVAEGYVSFYEELTLEDGALLTVVLEQASDLRELINSAPLRPYTFSNGELTQAVDALFAELFLPGMDTYDKVKACYDWLVENTVYKRPGHTGSGSWDCALQVFRDGKGTCDCYSSAFAAMMRRIGLESYVVEGITAANRGGMTGHVWSIMVIGDETYVFDPQVEDAIADRTDSKEIDYVRFCLPEPNGKYKYNGSSRARQMARFDLFLEENGYFE